MKDWEARKKEETKENVGFGQTILLVLLGGRASTKVTAPIQDQYFRWSGTNQNSSC